VRADHSNCFTDRLSVDRKTRGIRVYQRATMLSAALAIAISTPTLAADFPTVVANILNNQTDNRISRMGSAQKQEMIACVNAVLTKLPNGRKRYVVEGATFDEQQDRFGEVVQANRAEWEQKIARACASIAVRRGGIGSS
jgi:hypothetical protein